MTTLRGKLQDKLTEAMRAKDEKAKGLLRLVLGETQLIDARAGGCGTLQADDARVMSVMRKIMESNNKSIEQVVDHDIDVMRIQAEIDEAKKPIRAQIDEAKKQKAPEEVLLPLEKQMAEVLAPLQQKMANARRHVAGANLNCKKLQEENKYYEGLLPQMMSVEDIVLLLAEVADGIKTAKGQGQAMGVAMKHLKGQDATNFNATDVAAAVEQLRK